MQTLASIQPRTGLSKFAKKLPTVQTFKKVRKNIGGETIDPEKTMPRALIAIVTIVAILYVVVALTLTGMLPLSQIHQEAPLAHAFSEKGSPTVALFVGAGAVGMTKDTSE